MPIEAVNINDTFFEGVYQDVWKKLIPPGLSEVECDFIKDIGGLNSNDTILDIMCGYGRHALELARRGFAVTAVDNSITYINEINLVAQREHLTIEALAAGALDVAFSQNYQAVICMGNSFAFFKKDDAVSLLKKLANCLAPDGVLIINSWMIAEIAIKHFREKEWYEVDGYKYLLDYKFHFQPSRIESEHTIIAKNNSIEVIHGVDYIFTLAEMEAMFQEAGLTTKGLYGTPKKRPFKMGDNRIYIVAGKE